MTKSVNIILFGSSGSGKSSCLNALYKMARYTTLEEAKGDISQAPIPVRCKHKGVIIREGEDTNERKEKASSRTKNPRIYVFPAKDVTLRIIDTPGIGDTDGSEEDQKNMDNILSCITQCGQIHAILFLFKKSDNRLTAFVKYQLCELFSCIGHSAVNNIKFIITHAGISCDAGEADDVIEAFMEAIDLHMPCTDENRFCFENDPFFYLIGRKNPENKYTEDEEYCHSIAYKNTASSYTRLLKTVFQCQTPYDVGNMTALKKAHQLWPTLSSLIAVLDKREKDIKEASDRHKVNIERLMWQIASDTAKLVKYEIETYKEVVRREKWTMEEKEVDVDVPTIDWKDVIEKIPFPRIEREERQKEVTAFKVEYQNIQREEIRQVCTMEEHERPVERQRRVDTTSNEGANYKGVLGCVLGGAAAGSFAPGVGNIVGAGAGLVVGLLGFGGSRSTPQYETYTDTETYQAPVIREVTRRVPDRVPQVVTETKQETYYEPVIKNELIEVTKKVPEVLYVTRKKKKTVPKKEEVFEEEQKERIVQIKDPEVQKRIEEKEAQKRTEEETCAKCEIEYEVFSKEKEQLRELVDDAARCLQENTIVGFNFAKVQYLEEELMVKKRSRADHKAVKWLEERLVEAKTNCAIFNEAVRKTDGERLAPTPAQLMEKIEKLCELRNFGSLVRQKLSECKVNAQAQFETKILKDAAEGYMFNEMVESA